MARNLTRAFHLRARVATFLLLLSCASGFAAPASSNSVYLEDLTAFEVRAALSNGSTTVLVPIGGTEQNGPHMVLGKHNVRVKYLAGQIAQKLGNALVAPVLAYVPEGAISPPAAHMRFSGTISISEATFESVLESTARSFKQHGFHEVVFLGDHGGYQKSEIRAAEKVNKEWAADARSHALALTAYYEASQAPFIQFLKSKGLSDAEIGTHAGSADTALMLAIDKSLVRTDLLDEAAKVGLSGGVYGDPRKATAELGQAGIRGIVDKSVQAIQEAVKQRAPR